MRQYSKKTFVWIGWMWMIFFLMPTFEGVHEYTKGLDPSWCITLKVAIENKFRFGQDFLFTYGPLGFLNTGYIPSGFIYQLVSFLVHLLIQVGFVVLIIKIVKKSASKVIALFFAGLCFFPYRFVGDLSFTLLILQIGFLLLFLQNKKIYSLGIVTIITITAFFIKLNLSLAMLVIWFGSLLFFVLRRYLTIKFAIILASSTIVLMLILAFILQTDILIYLTSGVKLIDGYIDAQAVMNDINGIRLVLALLALLVIISLFLGICWDYLPYKVNNKELIADRFYVICLIAMSLFLSYKQSFASLSSTNLYGFFLFFPVMIGLILLVENSKKIQIKVIVLILCSLLFRNVIHWYWTGNVRDYVFSALPTAKKDLGNWQHRESTLEGIGTFISTSSIVRFFTHSFDDEIVTYTKEDVLERSFPHSVNEYLSKGTVDILPWEISYIMVNKLKYNPRPIVQTYQAYSGYLDSLNAQKYQSSTAPDYLLYQELPYREQYFFWDEDRTKLSMLANYKVLDTLAIKQSVGFDSLLVLKQNANKKTVQYNLEKKVIVKTFEKIDLPDSDELLFLKFNLKYSLFGQITRLAFQPPYLFVNFVYDDNRVERFRVIPSVLKGGVIANIKVKSFSDASTFFNTKGQKNTKIKSIQLDSPYQWGFSDSTEISIEKVIF